jgi:uncharacterized protein (TIGR02271 family)
LPAVGPGCIFIVASIAMNRIGRRRTSPSALDCPTTSLFRQYAVVCFGVQRREPFFRCGLSNKELVMIDTNSISRLIGATVTGADGNKIGNVGQVYVDDETSQPSWMTVRTGLFGSSESFVPLDDVSLDGDDVRVSFTKEFVKDAPRIDNDGALSPEEEDTLYDYYSRGTNATRGADADGFGTTQQDYRTGDATEVPSTVTDNTGDTTDDRSGFTDRVDRADDVSGSERSVGHDTSGPTTDSSMTRSEEQLRVGTERVETGRARLRKYVVTETESVTVPLQREEVRLEREPITDGNIDAATAGPEISEEEHEVILSEERPVIETETVPVERVRLDTNVVTEDRKVSGDVRKERIDVDGDTGTAGTRDIDEEGTVTR